MNGRIEPTKANLIRLRREAAFAQEGLAILDRKREILLRELSLLAQECDQQRTKLRETIGRLSEPERDRYRRRIEKYFLY